MFKRIKQDKPVKRIKSKGWLELLTGENVEKAGTRVDDKSHIEYAIFTRKKDKEGAEHLEEVK